MKATNVVSILGALAAAGCAPVFSDLQSARLAGRGRVEVTPSASAVSSDWEVVQNHFGLQVATGLHDKVDLRLRYEHVSVDGGNSPDDGFGVDVVGFGPKLALVKDRLALAVPVGFAFGEDIDSGESWEIQPTLIGTLPVVRNLDVTVAGKYIVPLTAEDGDNLVALNVGLGLGPPDKWVVRPEVGFLWNPGEEGRFVHLSLGFSFLFGGR